MSQGFSPSDFFFFCPLSQPFDHLFSRKKSCEEVCVCAHECFLYVYPRPLAPCSIMCKAPHKPDQAETTGPFLHTLLSVIFFPPFVPSVPHKKEREMGSYGGNYFWEPGLSSIPPPPHHPHISIPLCPPPLPNPTCIKEGGRGPSLSESPF